MKKGQQAVSSHGRTAQSCSEELWRGHPGQSSVTKDSYTKHRAEYCTQSSPSDPPTTFIL